MTETAQVDRAVTALMEAGHIAALEQLPGLLAGHAAAVGLSDARLFVADLRETVLRELTGRGPDAGRGGQELPVDGSLPGRVYQRVTPATEPEDAGPVSTDRPFRWWAPVTDGVERLGVLRVDAAADDRPTGNAVRHLASLMALLLLSKRAFSDSYARLVRTEPMNVAAEMQWQLTPPSAFAGQGATVGAVLEPAHEVGGDAFDYALTDTELHLAVFDAVGHDTAAGVTANVAVAACRNARRQGASLAETGERVEETLIEQFGRSRYVTGLMARLDLESGRLSWVNRGHPQPVVLRAGGGTDQLSCPPSGPMGAGLGLPPQVCEEQLGAGDRLLLYTDGVTEARDGHGEMFGLDRFVDFVLRHHSDRGLTLHETLRRLIHAVLEHHAGKLDDDATVLLAEWQGRSAAPMVP
ncbi:PP2C family protein-serine/threonine phosphatase [Streptomyces zingiberis]|uniref:Serine/threonine-protein phosphatase n=1 Tax=Streptomyces zingiberis TaxID=2053010 RepID=A0ABX1C0M3_9ACTN|nr:PP2C family protein-serine/threonine phosphatase [Streptomyces zingiberis]NJQ03465.1 serine/threonine-protein phosphatase [Streptomyces zingiberis]